MELFQLIYLTRGLMKYLISLSILFLTLPLGATPLEFPLNGISTNVKVDTTTPANTRAYPYSYYSILGVKTELALDSSLLAMSAKLPATLGQKTSANSLAVVPASDFVFPLPTGAATEATLAALNAKFGSLGQKLMAGSAPVVIASDQSAIPVSQSGTWNINNISGTISLPTGAATSALQTTGNTSLSSIDGKLADNYGASTAALRTAAQLGNATGAADFNAGTSGAQTLRVSANITRNGTELSYGSGTTDANTQRVVLPTDQGAIATKQPINPNGSYAEITNLTTTAQTFTVPSNAVGFVIETLSDNTANIRYKIGAAATITSGMRLEPGRAENFNTGPAANISVIAESGTNQVVSVQWILNQ